MSNGRKKSPRSPSLSLEDALGRALQMYSKEQRHEVPADVAAQDIGYKSANNGAALAALASLRYYGLVERPVEGKLSVSKDVEIYKFAPEEKTKSELLIKWLRTPPIFEELIEKYGQGLPSDATIKFDLIQLGFSPNSADECVSVFRRSAEFARLYDPSTEQIENFTSTDESARQDVTAVPTASGRDAAYSIPMSEVRGNTTDRIPVRLTGGRRAWLEVPSPFYSSDKDRLIAQINLLLSDDDEEDEIDL